MNDFYRIIYYAHKSKKGQKYDSSSDSESAKRVTYDSSSEIPSETELDYSVESEDEGQLSEGNNVPIRF